MRRIAAFLIVAALAANYAMYEPEAQEIRFNQVSLLKRVGPANPDMVKMNGNWRVLPIGTEYTLGSDNWREFFAFHHGARIGITGPVLQVELAWPNSSAVTDTVVFKFWRHDGGGLMQLVGITENLGGAAASGHKFVENARTKITLDTPVTGIREGDYYSVHFAEVGTGNQALPDLIMIPATQDNDPTSWNDIVAGQAVTYWLADDSGFDNPGTRGDGRWNLEDEALAPLADQYIPVNFYTYAPIAVFAGASIMTGHNSHRGFWENVLHAGVSPAFRDTAATALDSTPAFYTTGYGVWDTDGNVSATQLFPSTDYTGWTYRNMGKGGNEAAPLLAFFTDNVLDLKPKIVFIGVGSADVNSGITLDAHITSQSAIMDLLLSNNIIGVFRQIPPRTKWATDDDIATRTSKHDMADDYNTAMQILVEEHGCDCMWVEIASVVGQDDANSTEHDPWDNKRDMLSTYMGTDSIHYVGEGHLKMAQQFLKALRRP